MKKILSVLTALVFSVVAFSQENTKTLMTIDGRNITAEEFIRVFSKNNNITPETEKKSVDEYLDLFINFKLKVIEAENLGYDTVASFIDELEGYRRQLAQPYLSVNEIENKYIEEAYNRTVTELRASHLMVRLDRNPSPSDTLAAYNKIYGYYNRIVGGEPFEKIVIEAAEDPRDAQNEGDLGYFSAFRMVYPFETAAYNTAVGQVSKPVRTMYGYHLIKITDSRPNRGEVKVAHIMTRYEKEATEPERLAAKEKLEKAYAELKSGADWNEMVEKYSENPGTKKFNGEIGWLKTGTAPEVFLDACHKLSEGEFSGVIETPGGYHIAKILEKKPVETFDELKNELKSKIEKSEDHKNLIDNTLNTNLKNKYGFSFYPQNATPLVNYIDSTIYAQIWDPAPAKGLTDKIVTVGEKDYTLYDYAIFLSKANKFASHRLNFSEIVQKNAESFATQCLHDYAINRLEKENPDFKYLLKEYHDGILLFNLTNDTVWKRAQDDTTGLNAFFKTAKKYNWNPRFETLIFEYTDSSFTAKLPSLAKKYATGKQNIAYVNSKLCPNDTLPCVQVKEKRYEKGVDSFADKLGPKKGYNTSIKDKNKFRFYYVKDVLPVSQKQLNEARGLYIADYQNFLEQEWIKQLRNKYEITVHDSVLNELKNNLK
ncbi:MAG: peptidylprolyl isomerase [Bacteroidales bacterium]|nr:peptidylprolyl isomerase [Bacteroidales bacterium]